MSLEYPSTPKEWTIDEVVRAGDILATVLGEVVAHAQPTEDFGPERLLAAQRAALIWRRIGYQATHPEERA